MRVHCRRQAILVRLVSPDRRPIHGLVERGMGDIAVRSRYVFAATVGKASNTGENGRLIEASPRP